MCEIRDKSVARVRLVNESKTLLKDKKFRVAGYDPEAREKASMKSWSFENPFNSQWGGVFERYSNMMRDPKDQLHPWSFRGVDPYK